jgi:hypothetical protein
MSSDNAMWDMYTAESTAGTEQQRPAERDKVDPAGVQEWWQTGIGSLVRRSERYTADVVV